ncbi:Gfo/Idh/MocA family protein [Salisediminibacterium selenitireducens]|uniref:Oxidoreductase domain protein n=1 Tax=Bacillus selenitireducens (strain ATCC 700615 / DSM 15326 / MLS10) TaxID=439292 RepID=D6XZR9_BACIE|nr:Gfo/Idh/MocA family oxidoreductase [Salisediminibacterium selenitireducens]ADI00421.1 oxidoreductase domain protein [[Bacillus] selenitireducens MLS10]
MTARTPLTVAVVGFGGMGGHHVDHLDELSYFEVKGIRDIRESQELLAKKKDLHVYPDLQAVLDDRDVDVVLIATPNDSHRDIAVQAMRHGKHVICEKPVAMNAAEMEEIMQVEQETGQVFVVNQNRRWDEDYLSVKKLRDEETIGEVFHTECRIHGSRGIPGDWRQKKAQGGGMLLDWGVHLVDRQLLMFPERVTDVNCTFQHIRNAEVDDGFRLTLTFESGKTSYMEVGTFNYVALPLWYVNGTKGSAVIHSWDMDGKVTRLETDREPDARPIKAGAGLTKTMAPRFDDGTVKDLPVPRVDASIHEFYDNVYETIHGRSEIIVKNDEVLRVMRLLEKAFESAETLQTVKFEAPVNAI